MLREQATIDSFTEFVKAAELRLQCALVPLLGLEPAREATAEALAYGWEHWDRLSVMENPAGYLYRVGVGKGRRTKVSLHIAYEPRAVDSPAWFEPGLAGALESLSEKQRVVVSLVHGYGWSLTEVAQLLGVGKSTVQSYEQRALDRLRRKLGVAR